MHSGLFDNALALGSACLLIGTACSGSSGDDSADDSAATTATLEDCSEDRWVGAWAAAPTDAGSTVLSDQSLRLLVTPLRSGTTVRLTLSNRFGDQALSLGSVNLGSQQEGAELVPDSQVGVTFDGSVDVSIPAGQDAVSDPIAFTLSALQPVAISLYLPAPGAAPTRHSIAMQTSYITAAGAGDVAADSSGDAYTTTTSTRPLVVGLDVLGSGDGAVVAAIGDSLTDGYQNEGGTGINEDKRYPDELARLLGDGDSLAPVNLGISGNRVLSDGLLADFGPALVDRVGADLVARDDVTDVILWQGINDIGLSPNATAEELLAGLAEVVAAVQAPVDGRPVPRVHVATLTPVGGTEGVLANYGTNDDVREAVNAAIRAGEIGDAVVDFDAAVRDPDDPSRIATMYDIGDHLHFNSAGYARLAEELDLSAFARRACEP